MNGQQTQGKSECVLSCYAYTPYIAYAHALPLTLCIHMLHLKEFKEGGGWSMSNDQEQVMPEVMGNSHDNTYKQPPM